jgi:hypothetical protein
MRRASAVGKPDPNRSSSTLLHLAVQGTGRGGTGDPLARELQQEIVGLLRHGTPGRPTGTPGLTVAQCTKDQRLIGLIGRR